LADKRIGDGNIPLKGSLKTHKRSASILAVRGRPARNRFEVAEYPTAHALQDIPSRFPRQTGSVEVRSKWVRECGAGH